MWIFDLSRVGDSMNGWAMLAFKVSWQGSKPRASWIQGSKLVKKIKRLWWCPKLSSLVCVCTHTYSKPLVTLTSSYQMRW
jgi:hypothetical protein